MAKSKTTDDTPKGSPFFFPEYQLTIYADDREAAEKQLEKHLAEQEKSGEAGA